MTRHSLLRFSLLFLLTVGAIGLSRLKAATAGEPPQTGTPVTATPATPTPGTPTPATATPVTRTVSSYLPYVAMPLPTATPTSTPTATPEPPAPDWLQHVNLFRSAANLHSLTENVDWSQGDWLHSRYMVKEDHVTHNENPSSPWYTVEGNAAGRSGNTYVSAYTSTPDEAAINCWMSGPFHAIAILDPQLYQTAFASYRENIGYWNMGATLDWQRGLDTLPVSTGFPIYFPADGGQTWLRLHYGGEWPDPLSSCPGYATPAGPPLIVQLGSGNLVPLVTDHGFYHEGVSLPHCVFDETNYSNPSLSTQNSGRAILNSRDAVVLMPRDPLQFGQTYTASITANAVQYSWTFAVVAPPQAAFPIPPGLERAGGP